MKPDLLCQDFRSFKKKSEVLLPQMSREEVERVRIGLQYLISSFDRRLASSKGQGRKVR